MKTPPTHAVISVFLLTLSLSYLLLIHSLDSHHLGSLAPDIAARLTEHHTSVMVSILILVISGVVAAVMSYFTVTGWRLLTFLAIALYFYLVGYPNFIGLVLQYGIDETISVVIEIAHLSDSMFVSIIYNIFYPVLYLILLILLVINYFRNAGS